MTNLEFPTPSAYNNNGPLDLSVVDFAYVNECDDVVHLRRVAKALEKEYFPQLKQRTLERIQQLTEHVNSDAHRAADEANEARDDLTQWIRQINTAQSSPAATTKADTRKHTPDVRGATPTASLADAIPKQTANTTTASSPPTSTTTAKRMQIEQDDGDDEDDDDDEDGVQSVQSRSIKPSVSSTPIELDTADALRPSLNDHLLTSAASMPLPTSSTQLVSAYQSLRSNNSAFALYLQRIPQTKLSAFFQSSAALTPALLESIVAACDEWCFSVPANPKRAADVMLAVSGGQRFALTVLMIDSKTKSSVERIIQQIERGNETTDEMIKTLKQRWS